MNRGRGREERMRREEKGREEGIDRKRGILEDRSEEY